MRPLLKKYYFPLFIAIFIIYSLVVIFSTSYIYKGVRFFSLSDDLMTGMRYAYNFAHGNGLLFNPHAEHIEGITNPLWVIFMAFFHLFPVPIEKISLFIQISGALFTVGALYFVKKIAEQFSKSYPVILSSLILSAFYFPLINWNIVQGTEVSILTFIITWTTFLTLKSAKNKKISFLLFFLLGVGTLVRMDFILPSIIMILYLFIFDVKNRKKNILVGLSTVLAFLTAQEVFRIWYFHDILPNTYYQKMSGFPLSRRIARGAYFGLKSFSPNIGSMNDSRIIQSFARLFILTALITPFAYSFIKRNKQLMLLLTLFTAQELYSIYVGGDVWEYYGGANRFIAFAMPLFFIAFSVTLFSFRSAFKKYYKKLGNKYKLIEIIIICLVFILFNRANKEELPRLFLLMPPTTVDQNQVNQIRTKEAYDLKEVVTPNARIGIVASGLVPYLMPDNYFCDILGKNDRTIATMPPHLPKVRYLKNLPIIDLKEYTNFQPGHTKWNNPHIVNDCKPDIFAEFWQGPKDKEDQYVLSHGYVKMKSRDGIFTFLVLKGSPNVLTEKLIPQ